MNPEAREEWTRRLRSGEVTQAAGALGHTSGHRCCLGVLCDIAAERGVIVRSTADGCSLLLYDGAPFMPSPAVRDWAGIDLQSARRLASLNDAGVPFSHIAERVDAL